MAPTGQKKVFQTADALWHVFVTVTADLGPGSDHARGTVPLHPTGHWRNDDAVEFYGKKVFDLEDVQIMRSKNWLEQGLRKVGVRDYWVLQRVIAATMEYTITDFEHLMRVFFVEWEKDLKPDGRTNRNKDQWTRWCEIHLIRHHRSSKAVRCLNVLEALGLLFPGWWKQVYALNNNTAIHNDTYASPWDLHPSPDVAEMDALNQKYARVPQPSRAQIQAAPQVIQQNTPVSRAVTHKKNKNKRQKTAQFQQDLDELDDAFDATTQAQTQPNDEVEDDIKSEESFTPEDYYPDYVHEYDAVMGKPATTYPQLPHTVSFAPGAEAWRNMNDSNFYSATRFNPEINATRLIDSAAMDAVPAPPRANTEPVARPFFGPERPPTGPAARPPTHPATARPQPTPTAAPQPSLNWLDLDERDFARAVHQVDADFPQLNALRPSGPVDHDPVAADPAVYAAVAGYKGVARAAAGGPVVAAKGDEDVVWGFEGEHDGAPAGPAAPSSGAALKLPRWPVRQ